MNKLLSILVLLVFMSRVNAQEFRHWDQGDLAYDDFQGAVLEVDSLIGSIYFDYKLVDSTLQVANIDFLVNLLAVGVNQEKSWINFDLGTDQVLNYFQVLFDIEHLYTLKYNKLVLENPKGFDLQLMEKFKSDKEIDKTNFILECKNGQRPDIMQKWSARIASQIQEVKILTPKHYVNTTGFGVHMGISRNMLGKDLNKNFGNHFGLAMGFDLEYKKYFMNFAFSLGVGRTERMLTDFPGWGDDLHVNDVIGIIGFGRKFQLNKLTLTPYIGPSLLSIYINKEDYESVYPSTSDTPWKIGAGLNIDYTLTSRYKAVNNYSQQASYYSRSGIRLHMQYIPEVSLYNTYAGHASTIGLSFFLYIGNMKEKQN